jgi:hypothetical protein
MVAMVPGAGGDGEENSLVSLESAAARMAFSPLAVMDLALSIVLFVR